MSKSKNDNDMFVEGWNETYGEEHKTLSIIVNRIVKLKSKLLWFYKGKVVLWKKKK